MPNGIAACREGGPIVCFDYEFLKKSNCYIKKSGRLHTSGKRCLSLERKFGERQMGRTFAFYFMRRGIVRAFHY